MKSKRYKLLRKVAARLAAEKIKQYLKPEEAAKVTIESVREFEKKQDKYMFDGTKLICSPFSTRWFYRQLKKGKLQISIGDANV